MVLDCCGVACCHEESRGLEWHAGWSGSVGLWTAESSCRTEDKLCATSEESINFLEMNDIHEVASWNPPSSSWQVTAWTEEVEMFLCFLKINSKGSVVLSTRCKGLWRECVWDKFVKIWTCDVFSSYLNPHPGSIILTRSLIITSSIVSVMAFVFLLLGFKHFSVCHDSLTKQQYLQLSAAFYFLVGISSCAGIVRYCVYVYHVHQYEVSLKIPGFPSFEYGYSLWMAVGGSLGAIATAILSCYEVVHKKKPKGTVNNELIESEHALVPDTLRTYV
ncbi:claudin-16-like [Lissotriton helveticus]